MPTTRITTLFPILAIAVSVVAFFVPLPFAALQPLIVPGLGLIMLGMGLTLTFADFREVLARPLPLILGLALQILVMPAAGWIAARLLGLDAVALAGMVLVGAAPVGTAASVVVYLARGNTALAVSLTVLSTLFAIVALPILTMLWADREIGVPAGDILVDVIQIVIAPVAAGAAINTWFGRPIAAARPFFPLFSIVVICLVIGAVVALTADTLVSLAAPVALAVVLHNGLGLAAGYGAPALVGMDRRTCRTLAICVGMQNSGLAVALAVKVLAPGAALPGALFSVWHNLTGALLAGLWSRGEVPDPVAGPA